jgi:hypothetical protein
MLAAVILQMGMVTGFLIVSISVHRIQAKVLQVFVGAMLLTMMLMAMASQIVSMPAQMFTTRHMME